MPRRATTSGERVLAHKKARTVHLGEHMTLLFEDELTVRYQIQEMLRIEKVFEEDAIQDELDAYNPLVPDGSNFKATMLIEYEDADARTRALAAAQGCRGARVDRGRGLCAGSTRSPTRTCRATNDGEDLRRALPALRALAGHGGRAEVRRRARHRRRPSGLRRGDSRGPGDARGAGADVA